VLAVHVRNCGSHFDRRGGCIVGGPDITDHHRACRVSILSIHYHAKACNGIGSDGTVTEVTPEVEIPVLVKMANLSVVPRLTRSSADAEEARRTKRVTARKSIVGVGETW